MTHEFHFLNLPEAYLELSRKSTMEFFFTKLFNDFYPLTIFAKKSIADVPLGSKYPSAYNEKLKQTYKFTTIVWQLGR